MMAAPDDGRNVDGGGLVSGRVDRGLVVVAGEPDDEIGPEQVALLPAFIAMVLPVGATWIVPLHIGCPNESSSTWTVALVSTRSSQLPEHAWRTSNDANAPTSVSTWSRRISRMVSRRQGATGQLSSSQVRARSSLGGNADTWPHAASSARSDAYRSAS